MKEKNGLQKITSFFWGMESYEEEADERNLRKWEKSLQKREACARAKDKELAMLQQRLENYELQMQKREQYIAVKVAEQEHCRDALEGQKRKLEDWRAAMEQHYAEREKKLLQEEAFLNQVKESANASAQRCYRDLEAWSQWESKAIQPKLEGHVQHLRQDFTQIRSDLSAAQQSMVDLMCQVQKIQNIGIEELCCLHRYAASTFSDDAQRFAGRLAVILRESFGATPIEPAPGDHFDSAYCERGTGSGCYIAACIHRGWRWKDGVFRAITANRESP